MQRQAQPRSAKLCPQADLFWALLLSSWSSFVVGSHVFFTMATCRACLLVLGCRPGSADSKFGLTLLYTWHHLLLLHSKLGRG